VARVYALGLSYTPQQAIGDYAQAVLRFESGVIAHVEASWAHAAFRTTVEIAGEHGLIRHDSDESAPLRADQPASDDQPALVLRRGAWPTRPYEAELRHFFDRLADNRPFLTDGEEGRRSLEVALAVLTSIRTGRPVRFAKSRALEEELSA
jgi:predicted dehydrogenase